MMKLRVTALATVATCALLACGPAWSQAAPWAQGGAGGAPGGAPTSLSGPGGTMPQPQPQPQPLANAGGSPMAMPSPGAALQSSASRGPRPGESLNLTQKAWEDPGKHMGKGQTAPGYTRLSWAADKILTVNTREGLITTIAFPAGEAVTQTIVSDPASFESAPSPDKRAIAVKPIFPGIDGNLVVYGSSGNIYNIYLKSTPYNDPTLSDMRVSIDVPSLGDAAADGGSAAGGAAGGRAGSSTQGVPSDDPSAALTQPRARGTAVGRDFAAVASTGPGRLRTDLRIMVSNPDDSIIAPVAAWRDDKFMYLDYGPRAASMNTWPVASLVVDQVESPVGTRVSGPNRSVMVVEALGDVVLRNGDHVVCVKMDMVDQDPRRPKGDETYRDRPGLAPVVLSAAEATRPTAQAAVATADEGSSSASGLRTGPYHLDKALALASDIVRGYHGKVTEDEVHIVGPDGAYLTKDEILKAPNGVAYEVDVAAGDRIAPQKVCSDLKKSGRHCRLR